MGLVGGGGRERPRFQRNEMMAQWARGFIGINLTRV